MGLDGEGCTSIREGARLGCAREGLDGRGSDRMKEGGLGWGRHGLDGEGRAKG
jgi:hypothetical protein